MSDIPAALREMVVGHAGGRCEYCGLAQAGQEATFHIDHIHPRAAGGQTDADNLALACVSCSLRRAARLEALDTQTQSTAPIFNPRQRSWREHFRWEQELLIGLTPVGRATIDALAMNRPLILAIRREEAVLGRHPG